MVELLRIGSALHLRDPALRGRWQWATIAPRNASVPQFRRKYARSEKLTASMHTRSMDLMSGSRFPRRPEVLDYQCQYQSRRGWYDQADEAIKIGE